jgi:DNA-binding transcriptional ArsR family regulator
VENRRSRSKIATELPPALIEAVNTLLVQGKTYQDIAEYLKNLGHDVSKSAVGRYGKNFMTRLEKLRLVKEQARAIVDVNPDAPATEMAEAANQLATQLIMEFLMQLNMEDLKEESITEILKALSKLEQSGVGRERLKFNFNKGADAAAERIKAALKAEIANDAELLGRIAQLVDSQVEALKK